MRIELNRFDDKGAVSTSYVELTPEQIGAIVRNAHEVSRLHREGKPLDMALAGLDGALVSAQVMEPASEASTQAPEALKVTPSLVDAFSALRQSGQTEGCPEGSVMVSMAALDSVGDALQQAVSGGVTSEWKWVKVPHSPDGDMQSYDLQAVLEKMSTVAKLGGAPNIKDAMTKYPTMFCQAFAELVEQEQRARERSANATTVVHLDNDDGHTVLSLGAPAGMSESEVQAAVQTAVVEATEFDDIQARLVVAGFDPIEHITVNVGPLPGDESKVAEDSPR
jgi:hypothetical protein